MYAVESQMCSFKFGLDSVALEGRAVSNLAWILLHWKGGLLLLVG